MGHVGSGACCRAGDCGCFCGAAVEGSTTAKVCVVLCCVVVWCQLTQCLNEACLGTDITNVSKSGEPLKARSHSVHRTNSKYWFSGTEFPALVSAFFGANGTGSTFSMVQYLVLLRYLPSLVIDVHVTSDAL